MSPNLSVYSTYREPHRKGVLLPQVLVHLDIFVFETPMRQARGEKPGLVETKLL
jgi:hypothetical protein